MSDHDHIHELLDDAKARLLEHCDSVAIFVTWKTSDKLVAYADALGGNIWANHGIVRQWMLQQDEISRKGPPEEPDSEE